MIFLYFLKILAFWASFSYKKPVTITTIELKSTNSHLKFCQWIFIIHVSYLLLKAISFLKVILKIVTESGLKVLLGIQQLWGRELLKIGRKRFQKTENIPFISLRRRILDIKLDILFLDYLLAKAVYCLPFLTLAVKELVHRYFKFSQNTEIL